MATPSSKKLPAGLGAARLHHHHGWRCYILYDQSGGLIQIRILKIVSAVIACHAVTRAVPFVRASLHTPPIDFMRLVALLASHASLQSAPQSFLP
jgi:hypothetical protein